MHTIRKFTIFAVSAGVLLFWSAVLEAGLRSWTTGGPEGAAVRSIVAAPTDSATAYAVTGAGVFATADGGHRWTARNQGLPTSGIAGIAVDPGNAASVYAACVDGLFKSDDRGRQWHLLSALGSSITAVAVDASRTASLYAIARGDVYGSIDGGETWTPLLVGPSPAHRRALVVQRSTGAVHILSGANLMSSRDHGNTWTSLALPAVLSYQVMFDLTVDPSVPSTMYVGGEGGLFKSVDGGQTWVSINVGLPYDGDMGMYFLGNVIVDPSAPSRLFTTSYDGVYRSTDQGLTWSAVALGSSSTPSELTLSTVPTIAMYAGTNGDGVFKTVDGGDNWRHVGDGLRAAVVNQIVATTAHTIVAATAAGVHRTTDDGLSWRRLNLALDVLFMAVEPNDEQTMYAGSSSRLMRSRDGGQTWSLLRDVGLNDYMLTLIIDPSNPATLYLGSGVSVSKSTDRGDTWTAIMNGLPTNVAAFSTLAVDRAGVIFTGSSLGMYRSTSGGASWTRIGGGLPLQGAGVRLLEGHPYDGSIYTSIASEGLFKSLDRGNSWQLIAFSKQDVQAFAIDPKSNAWYAATDSGVLTSVDGGEHWTQMSEGLPATVITSIVLDKSGKGLHAGTRGFGVVDYETASSLSFERLADDPMRLPRLLRAIADEQLRSAVPEATRKSFLIVAAASNAGANGTFFRSDITLMNRSDHEQDVIVAWLAADAAAVPPTFKITLAASNRRNGWFEAPPLTVVDFVRAFNLSGLGALLFVAVGPSADLAGDDAAIAGYSRIWSPASDALGTVSQALPGVDPLAFMSEPHAIAVGFRQETSFRTNVGIVNLDTQPRSFDCRAVGERSSAAFSILVAPMSMKQVSLPSGDYGPVAIEVWGDHDEAGRAQYPWMLYGSTVDNVTGDGWTATASAVDKR